MQNTDPVDIKDIEKAIELTPEQMESVKGGRADIDDAKSSSGIDNSSRTSGITTDKVIEDDD